MKLERSKKEISQTLGVSRSNLYYRSLQPEKDRQLKIKIEEALRYHPSYGHKRMAVHLKMGKNRVRRAMKMFNIKPYRRRGKKWLKAKATGVSYPNLLLTTAALCPNHIWASDFTYLWFENKWLYVATVIDLYTRKIVGLSVGRNHDRWLVQSALYDALSHNCRPMIIHSDHGSEYKSRDYQSVLREFGINCSMSAKGCPWENGYQESFYCQFKIDLGDASRFQTLGELTAEIYKQIYYYNNQRIHTSLKMAPIAFARQYDMLSLLVQKVS